MSKDALLIALYNHICLPPKLPDREDDEPTEIATSLTERLLVATRELRDKGHNDYHTGLNTICRALDLTKTIHQQGYINREATVRALHQLQPNQFVILHVYTQNAGLVVWRNKSTFVIDAFEAAARSYEVLETTTALQWEFPGSSVSIDQHTFLDDDFLQSFCRFLEQGSQEYLHAFAVKASKAGTKTSEERDTSHPSLICELMMTFLEVHGSANSPTTIQKRVRDDVCFASKGNPWRRSPTWLVLRVGTQMALQRLMGKDVGDTAYKYILCALVRRLCNDVAAASTLSTADLSFVGRKLARRLSKLAYEQSEVTAEHALAHERFSSVLSLLCASTLEDLNSDIDEAWSRLKRRSKKVILAPPSQATNTDLVFRLPNSLTSLRRLIQPQNAPAPSFGLGRPDMVSTDCARFANQYMDFLANENLLRDRFVLGPSRMTQAIADHCRAITDYMEMMTGFLRAGPECFSRMTLTLLELWVALDQVALEEHPQLRDHPHPFSDGSLEVLHLSAKSDMQRLHDLEAYLRERNRQSNPDLPTIFGNTWENSYAVRCFESSTDMQTLRDTIKRDAERDATAKKAELVTLNQEYNRLAEEATRLTCQYTENDFKRVHDDRKCRKCFLGRWKKRQYIDTFEYPLPSETTMQKVVCFELAASTSFLQYRDITWQILKDLTGVKPAADTQPPSTLPKYYHLWKYASIGNHCLTFASSTKSFRNTHYSKLKLPASAEAVCKPCALTFDLFDTKRQVWVATRVSFPSLNNNCTYPLSAASSFHHLLSDSPFAVDKSGPTPNEMIASYSKCPSTLGVDEFLAFQELWSGDGLQWVHLLREMNASNINFASKASKILVSRIAHQAGPRDPRNVFRKRNIALQDENLCEALITAASEKVKSVAANWREWQCVEAMLKLVLRLESLTTSNAVKVQARALLHTIRLTARDWARALRTELHATQDSKLYELRRIDVVWACLLARMTFQQFMNDRSAYMDPAALTVCLECSIIMQQNIDESFVSASVEMQHALIQDWHMFGCLRPHIEATVAHTPQCLTEIVRNIMLDSPLHLSQTNTVWSSYDDGWYTTDTVASHWFTSQRIDYNLVHGYFLVGHRPLDKLPAQHRTAPLIKSLFGDQPLLTYQSDLQGMQYRLSVCYNGHVVHVGARDGCTVIRAVHEGNVLEFVTHHVFVNESSRFVDLPGNLVFSHCHWLNLDSADIEFRPKTEMWKTKPSNWYLNVRTQEVSRKNVKHKLIDPNSHLFQRTANTFGDFEDPAHLILYQPEGLDRALTLQMRRLDLTFKVRGGLWTSEELRAQLDPNQDAGTWYGLKSKLVLRDRINPRLRSIIVPFGLAHLGTDKTETAVRIAGEGRYGRYSIDPILQRLACAAQPNLIYLKAFLHAVTSFISPDVLTGRTGTEEAINCLQEANAQPWTPLTESQRRTLIDIARLSPIHSYYPPGSNELHQTRWREDLPAHSQHESFFILVNKIIQRSETLEIFHPTKVQYVRAMPKNDTHLLKKSLSRSWQAIEDEMVLSLKNIDSDRLHEARDRLTSGRNRSQCAEISIALRDQTSPLRLPGSTGKLVEGWGDIRGFVEVFEAETLGDVTTLNIAQSWSALVTLSRKSEQRDKYQLALLLCVLSFTSNVHMKVIRGLIGFALLQEVKDIEPPSHAAYEAFRMHEVPSVKWLKSSLQSARMPFNEDAELESEDIARQEELQKLKRQHESKTAEAVSVLSEHLLRQWPKIEIEYPTDLDDSLINLDEAITQTQDQWQRLAKNFELSQYLQQVDDVLQRHDARDSGRQTLQCTEMSSSLRPRRTTRDFSEAQQLKCIPHMTPDLQQSGDEYMDDFLSIVETEEQSLTDEATQPNETKPDGHPPLTQLATIIRSIRDSENQTRHQYGFELSRSLEALQQTPQEVSNTLPRRVNLLKLQQTIDARFERVAELLSVLRSWLEKAPGAPWLRKGGLLRRSTCTAWLKCLNERVASLPETLPKNLALFGLEISSLQRLVRIETAFLAHQDHVVQSEAAHSGHTNWNPLDCPAWLLLEIESNFLIRPQQVQVARATIWPSSHSNSVLQMNMGEGKTSCIIPMAIAVLANQESLVRVVVPKPLLHQIAQVLQTRIGGILNREVCHLPYSRRTQINDHTIELYSTMHQATMNRSGVMLTLPEHKLSFELSGFQRLLDERPEDAKKMIKMQTWLNSHCRDILDESDFMLAVQTQLVYPSGSQRPVDGHPLRWLAVQEVLQMIPNIVSEIRAKSPSSIEIEERGIDRYPTAHLLRGDAENAIVRIAVEKLVTGSSGLINTTNLPREVIASIKAFLNDSNPQSGHVSTLQKLYRHRPADWNNLLHLRGILAHRVLVLTLKKRWNVQYGLHVNRDPVAVPYHAKGLPSDTAEWGHPDVAIILTCLSFYHSGLTQGQLRQSLSHVLRSDDKEVEYDRWIHSTRWISESLRSSDAINVDDEAQLTELWQSFRHNMVVIDYFLNHFVFPQYAKQFEHKLQASGWDIALPSTSCKAPASQGSAAAIGDSVEATQLPHKSLSTGFSGTNDNRSMLPLNIKQADLPQLLSTNAEVLTYLLEPRNRRYVVAADGNGKKLTEAGLLVKVRNLGIRVFIDAGAQILENDNLSFVKLWLQIDHKRPAAIFFNDEDNPVVYHRQGHWTPLLASPYAEDMSDCLVYLDQAHTRGTDLKLPLNATGALTLDLAQTKDHTVQAAMRLRQLGTTQSVVFFAPPEVDQSIKEYRGKRTGVHSGDVVAWLLEQTCLGLEQLQPLYVAQGIDYCRRHQALNDNPRYVSDSMQQARLLSSLKQKEDHSLSDLYLPKSNDRHANDLEAFSVPQLRAHMDALEQIRKGLEGTNIDQQQLSALQEVEQEREVTHEVETVREIQKPRSRRACPHENLSPAIIKYCNSGKLEKDSEVYTPAFDFVARTQIGIDCGLLRDAKRSRVYVSRDFARTVETDSPRRPDQSYLRPVNWVLYSRVDQSAIVVSPHEAAQLAPKMRAHWSTWKVHLIIYAAPVTRKMLRFDNLNFYALPPLPPNFRAPQSIRRDLRIFSGGLYFRMEDYEDMCQFLGVQPRFADPTRDTGPIGKGKFTDAPLRLLQEWLSARRHGQDFSQTPIGYLIEGKELDVDLPFFANT